MKAHHVVVGLLTEPFINVPHVVFTPNILYLHQKLDLSSAFRNLNEKCPFCVKENAEICSSQTYSQSKHCSFIALPHSVVNPNIDILLLVIALI